MRLPEPRRILSLVRGASLAWAAMLLTSPVHADQALPRLSPASGARRYEAALELTPMAKALIAAAYGKRPDRSYFGGCSNGGRHTFVAMTLVDWVENGHAPDRVVAYARGAGDAVGVNPDVPSGWSPHRSRPLCPYPKVAPAKPGATDLETADSFVCQ
jgi:hypothetical protein